MDNNILVSIPKSLENLQLPDPELLTYYHNLNNRVIWLETEIDDATMDVVKRIIQWNQEDKGKPVEEREPIKLFFSSPGGSLDICLAVVDAIDASLTPVYGYNMGMCCSAAAFIYIACHKRFMMSNSYFLFHQGSADGISGDFAVVCSYIEQYRNKVEKLSKLVQKDTDYDEEEIVEKIATEWYIYKDEALKNKVSDEIVERLDVL